MKLTRNTLFLLSSIMLAACGSDSEDTTTTTTTTTGTQDDVQKLHIESRLAYSISSDEWDLTDLDNIASNESLTTIFTQLSPEYLAAYSYDSNSDLINITAIDNESQTIDYISEFSYEFEGDSLLSHNYTTTGFRNDDFDGYYMDSLVSRGYQWENNIRIGYDYSRKWLDSSGAETGSVEYYRYDVRNDDGQLISATVDDDVTATADYFYNADGTRDYYQTYYSGTENVRYKYTYQYDNNKNVVRRTREYFDADGVHDESNDRLYFYLHNTEAQTTAYFIVNKYEYESNSLTSVFVSFYIYAETDSCGSFFDIENESIQLTIPHCITAETY